MGIAEQIAQIYRRAAGERGPVVAGIPPGRLDELVETERFRHLDRLESYYRARQDDAKAYDWDGYFRGYGEEAAIRPGWYVPLSQRRPCARYDLARVIVSRFTSLVFGADRFPDLVCEADPETEDFVQTLCSEARLSQRMVEARNLGGAMGTVCLSAGFVRGKPRIEVHNAKHCRVLSWADRADFRPRAALKGYAYEEDVYDEVAHRWRKADFYYVRYWDEEQEIIWERVPAKLAQEPNWMERAVPDIVVRHGWGFCPFYWVQNKACSDDLDGESDYEGLTDLFDDINRLMSAASRGTKRNVDPTLVVRADPALHQGVVRKGSDNAIFAPGGAEYLELKGQAVAAAKQWLEIERDAALHSAGVVLADPERLSGAAQSAAALRLLYAPMLAECDKLREQYGEMGIRRIALDLLRMARQILRQPARQERNPETGELETVQPSLDLPPRIRYEEVLVEEADVETGELRQRRVLRRRAEPRLPGEAQDVQLNWPPYFPATVGDQRAAVETARLASDNQTLVSPRTAVRYVAGHFGIDDIEQELADIEAEAERAQERELAGLEGEASRIAGFAAPAPEAAPAAAPGPLEAPEEEEEG